MESSFYTKHQRYFSKEKIFDPFEINENENIIEYQCELDPDKHYFNQHAHHLSRSSNYYSEENLNKRIRQKKWTRKTFLCYTYISGVSPQTCRVQWLIWVMLIFVFQWLFFFLKHDWRHSHLPLTASMDSDMSEWPGPREGEVVCLCLSQKHFHTLNSMNLMLSMNILSVNLLNFNLMVKHT